MRVFRWLGRFTMVAGPLFVMLVFALAAFLMWVLVTGPGTRWALTTAVEALDGRIQGVEGSVWNGLQVEDLSLEFPGVAMRLEHVELRADWRRLTERHLHVNTISVDTAWVDLHTSADAPEDPASEEPFSLTDFPVTVRVDDIQLGELILTQDGKPLPITMTDFASAVVLGPEHGQLWLRSLSVATDALAADVEGEANLQALQHPWPGSVDLDVKVNGLRPAAPVCFREILPTLPVAEADQEKIASMLTGVAAGHCPVELNVAVNGSLEQVSLNLQGSGQGMTLAAQAELAPLAGMPLHSATLSLQLPDGSSLNANASLEEGSGPDSQMGLNHSSEVANWQALSGELTARGLDAGQLAGGAIPPALLSFDSRFRVMLDASQSLRDVDLTLQFHEGSSWNEEPLSGQLALAARLPETWTPAQSDEQVLPALVPAGLSELAVRTLDMDIKLGANHILSEGSIGGPDSRLNLNVQAPRLADFWPNLPGGVAAKAELAGGVAKHTLDVEGRYTQAEASSTELGSAPVNLRLQAEGGWGGEPEGWRGRVAALSVDHAHLGLSMSSPVELAYLPAAQAPQWQWSVGATELAFSVNQRPMLALRHSGSRGGLGRWETEGEIERFVVSPAVLQQIGADFDIAALRDDEPGGVKVRGARSADDWEMAFGLDWSLSFSGAHQGRIQLRRLEGDLMVPGDMPFPLELEDLQLDVSLAREGEATSRLNADLAVSSRRMGQVHAQASTIARATPAGGLILNPADPKSVTIDAAVSDLSWTSLLVGDALDIGGAIQASVNLESRPDGSWATAGTIDGKNLRVVMIDQGVRLLDGTLRARLDNDRLLLERLEFPARLRAEPKEWRTAEWVNTNPDAKGGYLVVSGDWNLFESNGVINIELFRFPILQRADRYAMMTGNLRLDAALPDVDITGKLTADAGWFDLDMLGGIPTVDSDVVVIRPGEEQEVSVPLGISLDLEVDLGPRFYLTGYGLNSGLVGNMRVLMKQGKLTGIGALRTRGGAIEAYGQRLQLRRGAITFQGDITRPVLDIEALRTGLAVEAGVRVAGTARSPRIELVSYPAVSEIEKLSWLLLGHGPNDSGGDMALLFSVGSSFLSDGEPFYRRFGIDEVSMRSGEIASVASILPAESVVAGLDTGTSDIERRFINVSKRLSNGVTLSIRQALSDTGTVARASYRLARGLTAEASVGTINGLALVYRWFSRERRTDTDE